MNGNISSNWLVDQSLNFQSNVTNWLTDIGELRLAVALLMLLALAFGPVVGRIVMDSRSGAGSQMALSRENEVRMLRRWFRFVWVPGWVVVWLVLELTHYDFELLLLPVWRTIIDVPSRIEGWYSEPGRWAVLFEISASVIAAFFIWLRVRSYSMRRHEDLSELMEESDGDSKSPDHAGTDESSDEVVEAVSGTTSS